MEARIKRIGGEQRERGGGVAHPQERTIAIKRKAATSRGQPTRQLQKRALNLVEQGLRKEGGVGRPQDASQGSERKPDQIGRTEEQDLSIGH